MITDHMKPERPAWKRRLYIVIFEADTVAGKAFDVVLLIVILLSVGWWLRRRWGLA